VGRCLECGTWGTVDEVPVLSAVGRARRAGLASASRPVSITCVEPNVSQHRSTGVGELDRVLGGGVVPGSVTLLAGDPGVGKSTLLLKVAHRWAQSGRRALYISGEESAGQIRLRADRIGCGAKEVYLAAESDLHTVLEHIATVRPALVIVDSVQTMSTTEADGVAGGVTQVRAVTAALTATATSLPELVTTLAAVRRGALQLAVGGIIGGNTFDVLFLSLSDAAYRDGSLYHAMGRADALLTVSVMAITAILLVGLIKRERKGIGFEGTAILAAYAASLALQFVVA